jgi:hypothetical protein
MIVGPEREISIKGIILINTKALKAGGLVKRRGQILGVEKGAIKNNSGRLRWIG